MVPTGRLIRHLLGMIDRALSRHATNQYGLVSRSQLLDAGVTVDQIRHRLRTGHLTARLRGVYAVAGAPPGWHADLMAAVLYGGPGSAVSHRAAAVVHRLLRMPEQVEICTPRRRRARDLPGDWTVHTSIVFPPSDLIRVGGLTVTTVERTLIDLGAVVSRRRVGHAVDAALKKRATDLGVLHFVHSRRRGRGRRGAGVLAQVLETVGATGPTESPYERDFLELMDQSGMPLPVPQYRILDGGVEVARVDFAWPDLGVVVEIDGHAYHADRDQRRHDAARQNAITALGHTVLRFTTDQVFETPAEIVAAVRSVVRSRDG